MKIKSKVTTPFGKGIITDIEIYNKFKRYGIELDLNVFNFSPAYFFENEISFIKNK